MKRVVIWTEDDATTQLPDHVTWGRKAFDMFGAVLPEMLKIAKRTEDGPDVTYELKLIISSSYPGNGSIVVEAP